jgi:hypothetical protein
MFIVSLFTMSLPDCHLLALIYLNASNSTVSSRPEPAGRDWPLYGDEYWRIMFGNVPIAGGYVIYYDLFI